MIYILKLKGKDLNSISTLHEIIKIVTYRPLNGLIKGILENLKIKSKTYFLY